MAVKRIGIQHIGGDTPKENKFKQQANQSSIKSKEGGKNETKHEIKWKTYVHIAQKTIKWWGKSP
jgi:hypothetical protein